MSESVENTPESTPAKPAKLYPLDQNEYVLPFSVGGTSLKVAHKIRRPSLEELIERDKLAVLESETVNANEERYESEEPAANAALWDKVGLAVQGYRLRKGEEFPLTDWREVTDDNRGKIPDGHKAGAIRGWMGSSSFKIVDEDDGYVLEAETITVRETIGDEKNPDYIIDHEIKLPSERQRKAFKPIEPRFSKVGKGMKTKFVTHLKVYVQAYREAFFGISGVSISGQPYSESQKQQFLDAISPLSMRGVMEAVMKRFEANLSD